MLKHTEVGTSNFSRMLNTGDTSNRKKNWKILGAAQEGRGARPPPTHTQTQYSKSRFNLILRNMT